MKAVFFFITMLTLYRLTKTDNPIKVDLYVNGKNVSEYGETESRSVNLTCNVSGVDSPLVKWHKDRNTIKTEDFNSSAEFSTEYSSHFNIPELTCEDGGKYICQAGNDVPQDEAVLTLDVKCSPKLRDIFDSKFTVSPYEDLEFSFNVTSNPTSTIALWSQASINTSLTQLPNEFSWNQTVSGRVQTYTFSHHNITEEWLGLYEITVVNGLLGNLEINYTVSLHQNNRGEITQQPITSANVTSTTQDDNTTRIYMKAGDIVATIERLVSIGVCFFIVIFVLIVILAAILKCPCFNRCNANLPCSKSKVRNPRIWVTMPTDDYIYHNCNEPVFGTGGDQDLPEVEFNHLKTSTSCPKLNNIHIQIKDYQDTETL